MKIALSTDHAGMDLLPTIESHLQSLGYEVVNYGPREYVADDDYPEFIAPAARAVSEGSCQAAIIFGGSGQGEAMVANRFRGVRCAVYYGPAQAPGAIDINGTAPGDELEILRLSRQHNDANVLSLGFRFLTPDQIIQAINVWLSTPFSADERHIRRISQIDEVV